MIDQMKTNRQYFTHQPAAKASAGFTIVELLIATAVFSMVLLVFLTAFIRVSQLFYKGINMSNTQESTRKVLQDIADDVQFYHLPPIQGNVPSVDKYFCIGEHRYTYKLFQQVGPGVFGIKREKMGTTTCPPPTTSACANCSEELLGYGMQLNKLEVTTANSRVYVSIKVIFYGADNSVVISPSGQSPAYKQQDAICSGQPNSTQYCATADYTSTILQSF